MTPLHRLKHLADYFGCKEIFVKNKSFRFRRKSFKVLGAFYAMGKYLAEKLNMDIADLFFEYLRREDIKEKIGEITFVTATDGDHRRGLAWAAHHLGQSLLSLCPETLPKLDLKPFERKEPGQHYRWKL